jgi:hypothetical protein
MGKWRAAAAAARRRVRWKRADRRRAGPAETPVAPHLEADRGGALLDRLHRVLDLEDAALGAPGDDVGVILRG